MLSTLSKSAICIPLQTVATEQSGQPSFGVITTTRSETVMELGNLCFGHSRGNFEIPRHVGYEEKLFELLRKIGDESGYGIKYENAIFSVNPYCWCDSEDCPQCGLGTEYNFLFKQEAIGISWYKYPLRDSYCNVPISLKKFSNLIDICLGSVSAETV